MYGKDVDFYTIKGAVQEVFEVLGFGNKVVYTPESDIPFMHPGRLANISIGDKNLGYVGQVHPSVAKNYSIGTSVYVAVVDINTVIENATFDRQFKELPKFPAVQRDIAMLV